MIQTGSGYFFQAVGFVGSSQSFAFNSGSVSVSNPVKYVDPVDPPGIKRKSNDASSGKTVELGVLAASLVVGQLV